MVEMSYVEHHMMGGLQRILLELVPVHDDGRKGQRGVEETAVDHDDIYILLLHAGGLEEVIESTKHDD
jgi:hypothetical protein